MMDNKTQISSSVSEPSSGSQGASGLYGRSAGRKDINRTYIQGMKPRHDPDDVNNEEAGAPSRAVHIDLQPRPLAGVLYSVSGDDCGEIFPVYVGRNTIGSEPDCDVYLSERTVSPNHAVLLVRIITNDGNRHVTMNLTDYDSAFGTSVNGVRLGYDRESLQGNEIIQIGVSYRFVFIPLDAEAYGLGQEPGFEAVRRVENRPAPHVAAPDSFMTVDDTVYPNAVGEAEERTFYGRSYARKEDHSSKKTIN